MLRQVYAAFIAFQVASKMMSIGSGAPGILISWLPQGIYKKLFY